MKRRLRQFLQELRDNISRISPDPDQKIYYILHPSSESDQTWTITPRKGPEELEEPTEELHSVRYEDIDRTSFPGDPADRLILERLFPASEENLLNNSRAPSRLGDVLPLLDEKELWFRDSDRESLHPITVSNQSLHIKTTLQSPSNQSREINNVILSIDLLSDEDQQQDRISPSEARVISLDPFWILLDNTAYRVQGTKSEAILLQKFPDGKLKISRSNLPFINDHFIPALEKHEISLNISENLKSDQQPSPKGTLHIYREDDELLIELQYCYKQIQSERGLSPIHQQNTSALSNEHQSALVSKSKSSSFLINKNETNGWEVLERNTKKEQQLKQRVKSSNVKNLHDKDRLVFTPRGEPLEWLLRELPQLQQQGFHVTGLNNVQENISFQSLETSDISVSKDDQVIRIEGVLSFEKDQIPVDELPDKHLSGSPYVQISNQTFGVLPNNWMNALNKLLQWAKIKENTIQLPAFATPLVNRLVNQADHQEKDEEFALLQQKLSKKPSTKKIQEPKQFKGTLRSYQKEGVAWLSFLRKHNLNGILADDMGLGKTIQILALMQKIKEETPQHEEKPLEFLVVCPRSVVKNWEQEANHFVPSLTVSVHHGPDRVTSAEDFSASDLHLTTYGTLREDVEWFNDLFFDTIILDESQKIRNPSTQISKAVRTLNSNYKICLTGTPIQNSTMDLWAQFEYFHPGFLGPQTYFRKQIVNPIENQSGSSINGQSGDEEKNTSENAKKLQKMIQPLLLRRTKSGVEQELPPITKVKLECPFGRDQKQAYEEIRSYYRRAIFERTNTADQKQQKGAQMKILEGLTRLRQICCDPGILDKDCEETPAKIQKFLELCEELIPNDHKILVFSQFVQFLSRIEQIVQQHSWQYEYLDGSTQNRLERIQNFQNNPDISLFLISLKAGGEGINLTAADYIVFLDPWWNPATEKQATDRTHRIGQDHRVIVYRLFCPNTVEEKILQLQKKKRQLSNQLISPNTNWWNELSKEEIQELFKKQTSSTTSPDSVEYEKEETGNVM